MWTKLSSQVFEHLWKLWSKMPLAFFHLQCSSRRLLSTHRSAFSRSGPIWEHANLANLIIINCSSTMETVIDNDPCILSLKTHFAMLIIDPSESIFEISVGEHMNLPNLTIIVGLDKCMDARLRWYWPWVIRCWAHADHRSSFWSHWWPTDKSIYVENQP